MAMPCSLHAWMDSSSRTEPPGWMMAVMPHSASVSTLSRNGKNASDAQTRPLGSTPMRSHASWARLHANSALSTRLGWPGPMPMPAWSRDTRMALDFTPLHTRHANMSSCISASVGLRSVGTVKVAGSSDTWSTSCTSTPPSTERTSTAAGASMPPVRSTRRFFFCCRSSSAADSNSGAMSTSTNCLFSLMCSTISSVTWRFAAMMPPKALFGSQAKALS